MDKEANSMLKQFDQAKEISMQLQAELDQKDLELKSLSKFENLPHDLKRRLRLSEDKVNNMKWKVKEQQREVRVNEQLLG